MPDGVEDKTPNLTSSEPGTGLSQGFVASTGGKDQPMSAADEKKAQDLADAQYKDYLKA